jgi:fructosamine-3-kinase
MINPIIQKVADLLQEEIINHSSVGGGCIANSGIIKTKRGRKYFLKEGYSNRMFRCEGNGLKELAKVNCIKTPKVIISERDFLLLEFIEQGSKSSNFFQKFGKQFATLHKKSSENYGFYEDNFIGSTPQINTYSSDWINFYFNHRLLFQYKLTEKNGYANSELKDCFLKLESKLPMILSGSDEKPSLLHGDLWGGNYIVDKDGNPVLIDPAVYYGHREADLAMTKLFGGFSSLFYESYNLENPLKDGYEFRENVYLLYHVLNHLNLFGSGYYSQAVQLMKFYF